MDDWENNERISCTDNDGHNPPDIMATTTTTITPIWVIGAPSCDTLVSCVSWGPRGFWVEYWRLVNAEMYYELRKASDGAVLSP